MKVKRIDPSNRPNLPHSHHQWFERVPTQINGFLGFQIDYWEYEESSFLTVGICAPLTSPGLHPHDGGFAEWIKDEARQMLHRYIAPYPDSILTMSESSALFKGSPIVIPDDEEEIVGIFFKE